MNKDEKLIKLEELLNTETVIHELEQANSAEEVKTVFDKNGLDLSSDEVTAFAKAVTIASNPNKEIRASELEAVTGGTDPFTIITAAFSAIVSTCKYAWNLGRRFAKWLP